VSRPSLAAGKTSATPATPAGKTTATPLNAANAHTPAAHAGAAMSHAGPAPVANAASRPAGKPATSQPARPAHGASGGLASQGSTTSRIAGSTGKLQDVQTVAHLDQQVTYQYNALGRRDPFQPMIGGEFVGVDVGGDAPVDVGGMKVVGIVWGTEDKFAMCEDGRGQSLVLRAGDKVMNGVVESLRRDAVVVRITTDGQTQTVAIPLTRKGDKSNATR
jgi:hypothetical protein